MQESLIDVAAEPAPEPRATSKSIGAGDIVLVDKKGRRFHALVTELEQSDSGATRLSVRSRASSSAPGVSVATGIGLRSRP